MKRIGILTGIVSMLGLMLPATPANAAGGVGVGATCDPVHTQYCVTTQAAAVGAGTTVTGGQVVAACKAETTGALLVTVTCSVEGKSRTISLPGPNGVSAVNAPTSKLTGHEVCWSSTGFFTNPLGGVVVVTDQGCAIVTL